MEQRIKSEKEIARWLQPIIERIGLHTVPLFTPSFDGRTPPRPLGSGVLFHRKGGIMY